MECLWRSSNLIDALFELGVGDELWSAVALADEVGKEDVVITEEEGATRTPATLTSFEEESKAFWYERPSLTTWARDENVHPLVAMRGNELMNAVIVRSVISCSRIISPGVFGPEKASISSGFLSKQTHQLRISSKHLGLHLNSVHSNPRYCYKINLCRRQ